MRATSKTEPEKNTLKLMKNMLVCKSCENPLKHIEAKILTYEYEKLMSVSKPTFKKEFRYKDAAIIVFYNTIGQHIWVLQY